MTAAHFEDHPTEPDKVILRKPRLDQGQDYERGFIDGMMYQTETTVNRAVDAMAKRKWVGLTTEEIQQCLNGLPTQTIDVYAKRIEAKLKEKNT